MVFVMFCISNVILLGMFCGGCFLFGNCIVLSFGVLFVLMVIMVVVLYMWFCVIDEEVMSLECDLVLGLYLLIFLCVVMCNSQVMFECVLFVDIDVDVVWCDLDCVVKSVWELD